MSKLSALQGARFDGAVTVEEAGLHGMVSVKTELWAPALARALKKFGLSVPGQREIAHSEGLSVAWMAPDELLILCAYDAADGLVARLEESLQGAHALVLNISDARAVFVLSGAGARDALAKLAPVDLHPDTFLSGEMRRTRLAQVPAAFWLSGEDEFSLICFRSVAKYVFDILTLSARPAGQPDYF